jgi:thioredoxin reductase (NADPH)
VPSAASPEGGARQGGQAPRVIIVGAPGNARAWAIRDFLHRSDVPFEYVECRSDLEAREKAGVSGVRDSRLPVCFFSDNTRMDCPTIRQITEKLGWFANPSRREYDLAIYGAGPAGLSAAVYGASDGLSVVCVERWAVGGQAASTSRIENYLGFPQGVSGNELAERAREQAIKFGAEILLAREGVKAEFPPGKGVGYLEDGTRIVARASICATGIAYRRLELPGEARFLGAGVYYGAGASEAQLVQGDDVYVIGGGNSAGQAVLHFSDHARKVYLVVRDASLEETMSAYLIERIRHLGNVEVLLRHDLVALEGREMLEEITLENRATGERRKAKTHWVFVCIGGVPQTAWAIAAGVMRDEQGYIVTGPDLARDGNRPERWPLHREPYFLETNVPGVFAAGDVRHGSVKRCASAVGEGAMAVAFVHRHLAHR